jgi:hypothetical protein
MDKVAGGYYLAGNGDMRVDTAGMNLKGFTQYRSLADGNIFPGYKKDYLKDFTSQGILGNYVVELKHYGAALTSQTFIVEGTQYTIPLPNMTTQQRPDTVWPKSYGYSQLTSGLLDGLLHRAASQLKAMSGQVIVQIASEFDTDHEFGITDNDLKYSWEEADSLGLEAVNYIIEYMRSYGIGDNVSFSIGMGGFAREAFYRMHPDSLMPKIGYMQYNAYRRAAHQTAYTVFKRTKAWIDEDLMPLAQAKPIIVAEWGSPSSLADQADYIATVPAAIAQLNEESATGKIVMTNYFNSNLGWATLVPKQAGLDALKTAYLTEPYA